jgi:protein TonB
MMLAYAANRPLAGKRQSSPQAMLLIISAHVALLAAVMSAKMESSTKLPPPPPLIRIPLQQPPPPERAHIPPPDPRHIVVPRVTDPPPLIKTPPIDRPPTVDQGADPGIVIGGGGASSIPSIPARSTTAPIHHDPRLLTPLSELKPPYPASKLASEEEATLKLRLTIDEHGRVIAVEPIGYADREFLDAARRYIIAHWRYDPATNDGNATSSTTTISLRFQLVG